MALHCDCNAACFHHCDEVVGQFCNERRRFVLCGTTAYSKTAVQRKAVLCPLWHHNQRNTEEAAVSSHVANVHQPCLGFATAGRRERAAADKAGHAGPCRGRGGQRPLALAIETGIKCRSRELPVIGSRDGIVREALSIEPQRGGAAGVSSAHTALPCAELHPSERPVVPSELPVLPPTVVYKTTDPHTPKVSSTM